LIAVLGTVAIAWPLTAVAQQSRVPLVGVLRTISKDADIFLGPFRRYMKAIGWEEGRNIGFLSVFTEGRNERATAHGFPVTLNQRVQGSSPCAPTDDFNWLGVTFDRRGPHVV
jgi:hypothetical protein